MEKWLRSEKSFKIFHLGELKATSQNCLWVRKDDGLLGLPGLMETCNSETNISYCGSCMHQGSVLACGCFQLLFTRGKCASSQFLLQPLSACVVSTAQAQHIRQLTDHMEFSP